MKYYNVSSFVTENQLLTKKSKYYYSPCEMIEGCDVLIGQKVYELNS